jgi:predicted nucleotidyltransferase
LDVSGLSRLPEDIKDSVECRLNIIKSLRGVEKIIIFGSYAKGTSEPSSDIDVAVFFNTGEYILLEQFRTLARICACPEIDIQVQAFPASVLNDPCGIIEEIIKYGEEYR